MSIRQTPAPREFTGRHMLLVTGAFFGVIVSVNVLMAITASRTWTGLVVQNSYVASQEFQERQDAQREQSALGWVAALTYTPGAARFTIRDGAGNPVELGNLTIQFSRPVGSDGDKLVVLGRDPDGGYRAAVELSSGVWDAVVTSDVTSNGPYEFHSRFRAE